MTFELRLSVPRFLRRYFLGLVELKIFLRQEKMRKEIALVEMKEISTFSFAVSSFFPVDNIVDFHALNRIFRVSIGVASLSYDKTQTSFHFRGILLRLLSYLFPF